jgi:hypothetical protein
MATGHAKDPDRVRLGRLGALTVHAAGKTNTAPARAAWEAKILAEVDPDGTLTADERARRREFAMRLRMTRLAMARWSHRNKKAVAEGSETPATAELDARSNERPAA